MILSCSYELLTSWCQITSVFVLLVFILFYYESVGENEPKVVANLDAMDIVGIVGKIYIGNQYALPHTK